MKRPSDSTRAAIYARVSSDQQAEAGTIASQVAALEERLQQDGLVLEAEFRFLDEGYSGGTLVRPALERLRDTAADGAIDRLYVHSPDRLARKYAYQVLLVDEFQRCGVELIFLNRELGRSPEDDLLLQVQGMVAEYERAKILERSRRGKRHAAQRGSVNVLSGAPYGYRYISKWEGGGVARYEIVLEQARVVRQMFTWVGQERCSLAEVCRRLRKQGTPSPTGKNCWDRTTVWGILQNTAYLGTARYGKTRVGPRRSRPRPQRNSAEQPRRAYSVYESEDGGIPIDVPALVDEALFGAVAEQLAENRRRARQRQRGARYLLQGLLVCKHCGYALYGKPVSPAAAKGKKRQYAYYRCIGTDAYRFGGERVCWNKQVRTDVLEEAVWKDACVLLGDPAKVAREYERRLKGKSGGRRTRRGESLTKLVQKVKRGIARLIDAYEEGLLDKGEFEPRIRGAKERLAKLEAEAREQADEQAREQELQLAIGHLQEFAERVRSGLEEADWSTRREILRALVKRVEVDQQEVRVVYRVSPPPFVESPDGGILQDCGRGDDPALRRSLFRGEQFRAVQHARREPRLDDATHGRERVELVAQRLVVDTIKALGNVGIQDVLGDKLDGIEKGHDRVLGRTPWPKAVAVRLEPGFPFGFQGELDQRLGRPVSHGGDAEGPLLVGAWFGDPDPTRRLRLLGHVQVRNQSNAFFRRQGSNSIDASRPFASVVLGDFADGQAFGRPGAQ
jgi:site-specific DNA recombinase